MLKKISLVAIATLSVSMVTARPATANTACSPGDPTCVPTQTIPTPPAILAVIGMGIAGLRRQKSEEQ